MSDSTSFELPSSVALPQSVSLPSSTPPTSLLSLPSEILEQIAHELPDRDFRQCKFACKRLFSVLSSERLVQNASLKTQHICYLAIIKRENLFICGSGGTGKTFSIQKICKLATQRQIKFAITAPTGRASCMFEGGQTIHSFSGLKLAKVKKEKLLEDFKRTKRVPGEKNWISIDMLIVDEVSMLGASLIEKLDICARLARRQNVPFGGLQLIFSGDFLQLQPIFDKFAFTHSLWPRLGLTYIEMTVPVRQNEDLNYFHLLNRVRTCTFTDRDIRTLQSRLIEYDPELLIKPTRIYSKNVDVERINQEEFAKVKNPIDKRILADDVVVEKVVINKVKTYAPSSRLTIEKARDKLEGTLLRQCPTIVELKCDVQYILTVNLNVKQGLVNGARCVYLGNGVFNFRKANLVRIEPYDFFFSLGDNLYLARKQMPLKIGYATTVHSSQGMTLDLAQIDLGKDIFSPAMTYVALSRVKSLDSLYLLDLDPSKIRASKDALEFYRKMKEKMSGVTATTPTIASSSEGDGVTVTASSLSSSVSFPFFSASSTTSPTLPSDLSNLNLTN